MILIKKKENMELKLHEHIQMIFIYILKVKNCYQFGKII